MSQPASSTPEGGFDRFGFSPSVTRAISAIGFSEPRSIQEAAIPAVLAGRDVLGLAQTGTGKTAAFGLPIIERLLASRRPGPRALVLAPTRELAVQIHAELTSLAQFTPVKAVTVFGGVPQGSQVRNLRTNPEIVVACPGRLLDLLEQRLVRLNGIEMLVIDEADHMFDLGFLPNIRKILAALPERRQNLLFSATMPTEIRRLADRLLQTPHVVELAHSKPASTIEHALYSVAQDDKIDLLKHLLDQDECTSAIVFSRTKHRAKRLADHLSRAGHAAVALQGNMSQSQRDRAMEGFRKGHFEVLVATDIAARGIDVAHVSHVINFDMPSTPDAYTHRIGRTGRAERSGKAYTFVSREDAQAVRALERQLGSAIVRHDAPALSGAKSRNGETKGRETASRAPFRADERRSGVPRSFAPPRGSGRFAQPQRTADGPRPVALADRSRGAEQPGYGRLANEHAAAQDGARSRRRRPRSGGGTRRA